MGWRRRKLSFLLSSSGAALLIGGSTPSALAQCVNTIGASFTNPAANTTPCVAVTNTSFTGSITNDGTISPGGITFTNGTLTGAISSSGDIAGGISLDPNSVLSGSSSAIRLSGSSFAGGISNAGTISGPGNAVIIDSSTFSGGVSNSGTISATRRGVQVSSSTFAGGISNSGTISVVGGGSSTNIGISVNSTSSFSGGISNSGTISMVSGGSGSNINVGISVNSTSSFSGGITNSGTISVVGGESGTNIGISVTSTSTFSGGISNSGTISVSGGGGGKKAKDGGKDGGKGGNGSGVAVVGVSLFAGGIANSGIITAARAIIVSDVSTFTNGITNSGTIVAGRTGIGVSSVSDFSGGISNSGSITSGSGGGGKKGKGDAISVSDVSLFAGGIVNSGTISGGGISVIFVSTFAGGITNSGTMAGANGVSVNRVSDFSGGISNSGTISVTRAGIFVDASTFTGGVANSGLITASSNGIWVRGASSFAGGISNSGTISAGNNGIFAGITSAFGNTLSSFAGGISNSGTISAGNNGIFVGGQFSCSCFIYTMSSFAGGITNSGTISASNGIFVGGAFSFFHTGSSLAISNFVGGISNSGTISASGNGIFVGGQVINSFGSAIGSSIAISTFAGGITNSGTISAGNVGIFLGGVATVAGTSITISTFAGGISNSGTISAGNIGILLGGTGNAAASVSISTFSGGISNSGTISAAIGIQVTGGVGFAGGAIANSGSITGTTAAIDISAAQNAITVNQTAGIITGAILLSANADVLNISGGAIAGNIVGQGAANTINFALGAGTFTYGNSFNGINQVNVNSGTTILTGANTAANVTVNGGTLQIGNGGTTGSINGDILVNAGGTFAFNRSDSFILPNGVSGAGGFAQNGTGTIIIDQNLGYTGGTTINGGILQIGNGGTIGSIVGNVLNNATLAFNRSNAMTFAGVISGAGAVVQDGGNTLILTGNSTYGGGTTINDGTLQLGNGGTAGSIMGNVLNNALLAFNRSDAMTLAGVISGTGAVQQNGGGTTILAGDNTYGGGTTINAGTLQLGNGGTTGSVVGNVLNNATLAFNRSDVTTFVGVISGTGAVQQNGAGVLELTGNHSYSGATTVNAGGLVVNGSIAPSSGLTVNSGGFVGGTGTLPTTVIANGGALSPGNSIGTISVSGNLTFNSGSLYAVEVSPTDADRTNVTGTASLAGTVLATFAPGSYVHRNYTILSASSRSGTFGELITAGLPAGLAASLGYTATEAQLSLMAVLGEATPGGLPGNQQNVANALNNFFNSGGTLPPGFVTLFGLTGGDLTHALNQVSGPAPTGAAPSATQMMNGFLSLTLNPYGGAPGGNAGAIGYARAVGAAETLPQEVADAYAAIMPVKAAAPSLGQHWSVWGQGFGGYNKTDGDASAGTNDTRSSTWGLAAGADYRVTRDTVIGFALAGGELRWNLAQGLGGGKSDAFLAGLYASHRMGSAYVSASVAYAWYDMSTDRTVTVAGTDSLRASFDAHGVGARLEAGYRVVMPWLGITPYVAGQVQTFRTPSYSEAAVSGSGQFALSYNSRDTTATRFELGSWLDKLVPLNNGHALMLRGRAAWAHDEGNSGGISAVFQTLPGASFTVNGAAAPRNLALVSAGSELRLRNGVSLSARFDGEFASRAQTYSGAGTVRYTW